MPATGAMPLDGMANRVGDELAVGPWTPLDQARISGFAEATGDRQWIHVDSERAAAELPGGHTIAHGFLVLAAASVVVQQIPLAGVASSLIYGIDRVRFLAPVAAGTSIRARVTLSEWQARDDGAQARWRVTVEGEALARPAAVFELIVRYRAG